MPFFTYYIFHMALSNQPPKGTADWFPQEFAIRKYIFDTWRKVCQSYGYQEYLPPLLESAEVYRAKSGEDIGGKELMAFTDQGGRELAIRPEMTPSVVRMVSQIYDAAPKPLRYFSIANFMRNEKPQRGRNREFWQLNVDIFGSDVLFADLEILQMALDIMLAFDPPERSFLLYINSRKLLNSLLDEVLGIKPRNFPQTKTEIMRTLDKWDKLSKEDCAQRLQDAGLDTVQIEAIYAFMSCRNVGDLLEKMPDLAKSEGAKELKELMDKLGELGYGQWIEFKPNVVRGLDYYDGTVFEVFDMHPDNNRSLFGGGRYNGLAEIFGAKSFSAVGFAPGDEPMRIFLESWDLVDKIRIDNKVEIYYLPVLDKELSTAAQKLAQQLRISGKNVILSLEEQKINKALDLANKQKFDYLVILGGDEQEKGIYKIKDMQSGEERETQLK
jgi:histidyl-tRNA synthetase